MSESWFRTIYVIQPAHDFGVLRRNTGDIRFITTGLERVDALHDRIQETLKEFDPSQDAIVAVGKSNSVLMVGAYLQKHFPCEPITLGLYNGGRYQWVRTPMS